MSTKRNQFIVPSKLLKGSSDIARSIQEEIGTIDVQFSDIDTIKPDPNNPRNLGLTLEEIMNGPDNTDPDYAKKQEHISKIRDLANTFKSVPMRRPIEVYVDGAVKRIIDGERRYWASIINGDTKVKISIERKKPEYLRLIQWVSNQTHEKLQGIEAIENVLQAINEIRQMADEKKLSLESISQTLGISRRSLSRYLSLDEAKENPKGALIFQALKTGKLHSIELAAELLNVADLEQIEALIETPELTRTVIRAAVTKEKNLKKNKNPTLKTSSILLKLPSSTPLIKLAFSRLANGRPLPKINWDNPNEIKQLFNQLIEEMSTENEHRAEN